MRQCYRIRAACGAALLGLALAAFPPASAQTLVRNEAASAVVADVFPGDLAWADYDGDGDLDLFLTGGSINASNPGGELIPRGEGYRNDDGVLVRDAAASDALPDVLRGALAWADYDGDGDPDLALTGYRRTGSGDLVLSGEVYRNDGGTLVRDDAASAVLRDVAEGDLAWGDYDGDGDPDLVLTGNGALNTTEGYTELYRNDGGVLVLDEASLSLEGSLRNKIAWVDYDGDGDLDLSYTGGQFLIYRNDDGTFVPVLDTPRDLSGVGEGALAWGDYDGDGDPDLAIVGGGRRNLGDVYRNDGGVLVRDAAASYTVANLRYGGDITWTDYDGDGDPDLTVTGVVIAFRSGMSRGVGQIYRNDGGVLGRDDASSDVIADGQSSLAWADYDGDGDLDLAQTGFTFFAPASSFGEIYENVTPLEVALRPVPVGLPRIVVAPGESFLFNYNLTNTTAVRQGGDAWFVVTADSGDPVFVSTPVVFSLRQYRTRSWRLLVEVPSATPPGDYTLTGNIGAFPDVVYDSDTLTFTVEGGAATASRTDGVMRWSLLDADTGLALADWSDKDDGSQPAALAVSAPYPNPTAGAVTVPFAVPEASVVRLGVFDVLGREVARLVDGPVEPGTHRASFETGTLPAGTYLVRLEVGGVVATSRLTVAR